jgi:hypothetical protein
MDGNIDPPSSRRKPGQLRHLGVLVDINSPKCFRRPRHWSDEYQFFLRLHVASLQKDIAVAPNLTFTLPVLAKIFLGEDCAGPMKGAQPHVEKKARGDAGVLFLKSGKPLQEDGNVVPKNLFRIPHAMQN